MNHVVQFHSQKGAVYSFAFTDNRIPHLWAKEENSNSHRGFGRRLGGRPRRRNPHLCPGLLSKTTVAETWWPISAFPDLAACHFWGRLWPTFHVSRWREGVYRSSQLRCAGSLVGVTENRTFLPNFPGGEMLASISDGDIVRSTLYNSRII